MYVDILNLIWYNQFHRIIQSDIINFAQAILFSEHIVLFHRECLVATNYNYLLLTTNYIYLLLIY